MTVGGYDFFPYISDILKFSFVFFSYISDMLKFFKSNKKTLDVFACDMHSAWQTRLIK